jgi:hypothetical protein
MAAQAPPDNVPAGPRRPRAHELAHVPRGPHSNPENIVEQTAQGASLDYPKHTNVGYFPIFESVYTNLENSLEHRGEYFNAYNSRMLFIKNILNKAKVNWDEEANYQQFMTSLHKYMKHEEKLKIKDPRILYDTKAKIKEYAKSQRERLNHAKYTNAHRGALYSSMGLHHELRAKIASSDRDTIRIIEQLHARLCALEAAM